MSTYSQLLKEARAHYRVPAVRTMGEATDYLTTLGAKSINFKAYRENLVDEFVDAGLVIGAFTIFAPDLLQQRATGEEREQFFDDSDDFDPLEYGVENKDWTIYAHEVAVLQRVIVVLECDAQAPDQLGSFRVFGGGQWLRESLWAATGVVPRDPGAPSSESGLFSRAFAFFDREPLAPSPVS